MFFLKRAIGGFAVLMIGISAVLPMFPSTPPAPQLAPERATQVIPEPQVTLKLTASGRQVVLPMEEYVVGVVAAEMDPSFPPAALAAQAILARTYTLRHLQLGQTASDDPGHFQAYNPARITDAIRQAVAPTRGMVVRYNGELVDAVYHSCSGGRTAGAAEGMGAPDRPYLRPVADPPCKQNENWTVRVSAASVSALAGHRGTVRSVEVGRKGPSGRALTVVVDGHEVSADRFREAVGDEEMKSTLVTGLHVAGNQVIISGRGFGHGVGLSQWGAAALAQRGFTAEEIIRHYYSDVRIAAEW